MELFLAEIYDCLFEAKLTVGVFSSAEAAEDALRIIMKRFAEKDPKTNTKVRFVETVSPIVLDGFTKVCMDWMGTEQ